MKKAHGRMALAATLAIAALPSAADAATIVYRFAGLFDATVLADGKSSYVPYGAGEFTGTGDTDDLTTGIGFTTIRLSSFTLTLGGKTYAAQRPHEFFVYPGISLAGFQPQGGGPSLWFAGNALAGYDPTTALASAALPDGAGSYPFDTDQGSLNVGLASNRSFSATLAAAVPEPATWGMMIAGFALVGAAMRRQRAGGRPGAIAVPTGS